MVQKQPETAERRQCLRARLFRQIARMIEAGAKPGQHLLVEDRRWDPRRPGVNDEPDRIRPDVDDRRRFGTGQLSSPLEAQLGHPAALFQRLATAREARVGHEIIMQVELLLRLGV